MSEHVHSISGGKYRKGCPGCAAARKNYRQRDNGARSRLARWKSQGMDPQAAEAIYTAGGGCLVCGATHSRMVVDHDHATGEVRGLLCSPCNAAIGLLEDSPARLRAAAAYLER